MKKHLLIVLILFTSLINTISYASDDTNSGEKVFNLFEVDTKPRVIKAVPPRYPINSQIVGIEGRVMIKFIVTKDGGVRDPKVIKAVPEGIFETSALEAIKEYRFTPAAKNGEPVDCIVNLPIKYSVAGAKTPYDAYEAAQKGLKFIKVGEYDNAVKAFTESIKSSKKYSPAYSGRGMAYMYLKEYEKAIEDFDTAIKRSKKIALNYKLRGDAYSAMKDYKKAIKDFDRTIKIKPDMLEAYFERGNAFRNLDRYSEAIEDYTKVIELDNRFIQAYNNRAVAYNKLKEPENMCLDIKKACDLGDCRGLDLAKNAGKCSADADGN